MVDGPAAEAFRSAAPVGRSDEHAVRPLATVAREVKAGTVGVDELFASFMRSRLYLPRTATPGLFTMAVKGKVKGKKVVPVLSSEMELSRFAGRSDWFSTDGFDLVSLLPTGVMLGLGDGVTGPARS